MKLAILFIILALLWVLMMANRSLKRSTIKTAENLNIRGRNFAWGKEKCGCGTPRSAWKSLAMNRPDNTVLLVCPQCMSYWEELMTVHGNKWRPVDEAYAKENFNYNEYGGPQVGS